MNAIPRTSNTRPMSDLGCMLQTPDFREVLAQRQQGTRLRFWIALAVVVLFAVLR